MRNKWKNSKETEQKQASAQSPANKLATETAHTEDIPSAEVIMFFGFIAGLFFLSFALKYIFPNVPEHIFEKILLIALACFCFYTLWKISNGLRHFILMRAEQKNIASTLKNKTETGTK